MALINYYRLLGIEREASGEEIKKAYRKLAMDYHPDRNQNKPDCEERLKEINEAYQVLGDEDKRRQYDILCQQPFYGQEYYQEGLNKEDLMEILRMFGSGRFGMRGFGGCKGMGFGRRACRRNMWDIFK